MIIDIEKLKHEVGEKLKAARKEKGLSQEELAKMLGLSKVGYGALERGKNLIGLQYLVMLTFLLKKPITDFLPSYAVTDNERNDPLLDPNLQLIVQNWSRLPPPVQHQTRNLIQTYLDLLNKKAAGEPLEY